MEADNGIMAQSNTGATRETGYRMPFPTITLHLDRRPDAEQTWDHHFRFQNNNAYGVDMGESGYRNYENILEDI